MEIYIDPKYGEDVIACNKRTADKLGKDYMGFRIVFDLRIGDDVLACHQKVFDRLKEAPVEPGEPVVEAIVDDPIEEVEEEIKLSEQALYALRKKDQVKLLKSFGISNKGIRKLRTEEDRVEAILMLQEE